MKIAIIGGGISGLAAAHRLHPQHDVTLFEAGPHLGGHVNTIDVPMAGRDYAIDTGFIVFNDRNYPGFSGLLDDLGIASQDTAMTFSVRCEQSGLEYNGDTLNTLFAQRRNLVRPRFYGMLRDILRFNREAPKLLSKLDPETTLGQVLEQGQYGELFRDRYLLPMGAAIWSACPDRIQQFPALGFIEFFRNHGLLTVNDRPQWRSIVGGSREYVNALAAPFQDRIRLATPVRRVLRRPDRVLVTTDQDDASFDQVIFACHSDQALSMLEDPSAAEQDVLGALPFQKNEAVLHTDSRLMPRRRLAWAAWNYHVPSEPQSRVAVTYDMNSLQCLDAPETFFVTLNYQGEIDSDRVIRRIDYRHPLYTPEAARARGRRAEISGVNRSWYCGAYWTYGFHEDGFQSGRIVADALMSERDLAA
jgi:predicted NAD/FAD-binding protein